jgi:hypothetical protein
MLIQILVPSFIQQLENELGKEAPLTVQWENLHDHLGVSLDYQSPGKVRFGMG